MKFLLDENLPLKLKRKLINRYPESLDVSETEMKGSPDVYLYKYAIKEKFTILTMDLDFSNIILYPPEKSEGIIVFRFKSLKIDEIVKRALNSLNILKDSNIKGKLAIISNSKIRVRSKTD